MTNDEKLMQQALDALERWDARGRLRIMEALRARLAQPEPEPVAWTVSGLITDFSRDFSAYETKTYTKPLYTAPPQREWQGLTDEEIKRTDHHKVDGAYDYSFKQGARWAEAKLKAKNAA